VYALTAATAAADEGRGGGGGGWGAAPWPPIRALGAGFGAAVGSNGPPGPWALRVAVPPDGCGPAPPSIAGSGSGSGGGGGGGGSSFAMLLVRGGCAFIKKVQFAQAAGAAAAVVINNGDGGYISMSGSSAGSATGADPVNISAVFISRRDGALLVAAVERAAAAAAEAATAAATAVPSVTMRLALSPAASTLPREDHVADFSGAGPTLDGRIKPDLVAPGEAVMSAAAGAAGGGSTCALTPKTGTSQAVPLVAAAAALVRQYLKEGKHWAGGAVAGAAGGGGGFEPSGALVRAVLVNGAKALTGYTAIGLPLERAPSSRQGFGRLDLAASLPVPPAGASLPGAVAKRRLFVRDVAGGGGGDSTATATAAGDVLLRVCLRVVGAVQVEFSLPIQACSFQAPGFEPFNLKCDFLVSSKFAFSNSTCTATAWRRRRTRRRAPRRFGSRSRGPTRRRSRRRPSSWWRTWTWRRWTGPAARVGRPTAGPGGTGSTPWSGC
jgi:hypothetical protein